MKSELLDWDTTFFGKRIFRAVVPKAAQTLNLDNQLEELDQQLLHDSADYVFTVVPTDQKAAISALQAHGWVRIESRTTFQRDELSSFSPNRRHPLREATPADLPELEDIVVAAKNPLDRFHGDPFYSPAQIENLMKEWIRASVEHTFADCVLVPASSVSAFITLRYHKEAWGAEKNRISQIVLNAVHPRAHGWYPKLISETLIHLRDIGAASVVITTQAANHPVIRTLEKFGFSRISNADVLRKTYT